MLAEHEAATRHALELERARIASELHDVVTHSVSVMIVQAGAARQVYRGPRRGTGGVADRRGERACGDDRTSSPSRAAQPRAGAGRSRHAGGTATPAELEPQPGLAQLHALVARLTAAGLPIDLQVGELPQELSPGLDLAVFRVIQESLTNVIKHAGKPPTTVSLGYGDGQLVAEVADTGRPILAAAPAIPAGTKARADRTARADRAIRRSAGRRAQERRRMDRARPLPPPPPPRRPRQPRRAGRPRRTPRRHRTPVSDLAIPPRVVVVDDQALVRSGFRMILGAAGITVVGEAADGAQAVAAVLEHHPDVVLMDIRMPEMDGLEATRRIVAAPAGAGCRIIILTTFDLDQYVYAALTAGASGFLLKDVSPNSSSTPCGRSAPAMPYLRRRSPAGWSSGSPQHLPRRRPYTATCQS